MTKIFEISIKYDEKFHMEPKIFFFLGFIMSFMSILIPINNTNISFLNIAIVILYLYLFLTKKINFGIDKKNVLFVIFCLTCIIASISSSYFLPELWSKSSWRSTLKYIIIFMPFVLYLDRDLIKSNRKYFFKGLYYATIVHLLWEILEIILFSTFNFHINQYIFGEILGIDIGRNWLFWSDGRMRPTGLSWEPANLSFVLNIGYCLTNNFLIKIIFVLGILLSTSRTGIGVLFVLVCIEMIMTILKRKNSYKIHISLKKLLLGSIIFIGIIIIMLQNDYIMSNITGTINAFINIKSQPSANRHFEYYLRLFELFQYLNIFQILFGLGVTCAGFGYARYLHIYGTSYVWTPETDYLSILIGNGFIGFVLYYGWIIKIIKNNLKNLKIILIVCAFLLMTTMAQFYRGWSTLILLFISISYTYEEYNDDMRYVNIAIDNYLTQIKNFLGRKLFKSY